MANRLALSDHLGFLRRFKEQVVSGAQKLDGTIRRRAELYIESARGVFESVRQDVKRLQGYDIEMNVLDSGSESCDGCVAEAERGWVSLGELIPIGERDPCMARCRCEIVYGKAGVDDA